MNFDIWMLLAGIGIFLFGIYLLEESLKALSGRAFKSLIRKSTSNNLSSIATGALSTAILQSSSAVTLMVLAFVGAGIMTLTRAFGVILGSNLGTTLSSWIVATVGFKFNIESLALPFIGIGGLGLIFSGRTAKAANVSKLMVGFGFLFLGLDYMKKGVEQLTAAFDLSSFQDYGLIFFLFIGFVITAIMQSSSAAMAIILTSLFGGVIDFNTASAMVIGANIGTTATVILGSIGGRIAKKQVALGHIIFNFITGIAAFIFLHPLNYLVLNVFKLKDDPVMALAAFHTVFNAAGILLFLPFMPLTARLIARLVKDKKNHHSLYIHNAGDDVPEAALEAIKKETAGLLRLIMAHNLKIMQLETRQVLSSSGSVSDSLLSGSPDKIYTIVKSIQSEIFIFSSKLQSRELSADEAIMLNTTLQAVHSGVSAAKTMKDISHELEKLDQSEIGLLNNNYQDYRKNLLLLYADFEQMLHEQDHAADLPRLVQILQKLKQHDRQFMKDLSKVLTAEDIGEEYISSLLSANRHYSLSLRQLTLAVKDLVLSAKESALFESMEMAVEERRD